jgi:hypothetical protein
MRTGVAMMRLSDLTLTPALTGLVMVALLLVGAIAVRVITASEHGEVRTHAIRATVSQGDLNQGAMNQHTTDQRTTDQGTPDTGIRGLRGTLQ